MHASIAGRKGRNQAITQEQQLEHEVNNHMRKSIEDGRGEKQWMKSEYIHRLTLRFKSAEMEHTFQELPDKMFKYYLACAFFVFLFIGAIQLCIMPRSYLTLGAFVSAFILLSLTVMIAMASPNFMPCFSHIGQEISENYRVRIVLAVFTTLVVYTIAFIQIVSMIN